MIESGSIGGFTSTDVYNNFAKWLVLFPGEFVILPVGTNDANQGGSYLTTFAGNVDAMVKAVLAVGKIPILPHIYWGNTANLLANVPTLNGQIDAIISANPGTIAGFDAYAYL